MPKPIAEVPKLKPQQPKTEPIKETPKQPFTPKMPQAMIPAHDMNQYYTQNMANMAPQMPHQNSPQLPPKPTNIFPGIKQDTMPDYGPMNTEGLGEESSSMIPINQGGFQDVTNDARTRVPSATTDAISSGSRSTDARISNARG